MKPTHRQWAAAALIVAAGILADARAFADPPGRVARLNYVKGSVSFRPASVEEWSPATLNYPLTTGDHLWTDSSSWAEMHIGSTAIRLAPNTAFAFLNLDDRTTQIRLSEGAVDVRVRSVDGSETFEIDTPSAAVSVARPGIYRVDVLPDASSTRVTVRYGAASVSADGPDFWVREGETAAIYGTDGVSHEIYRAAAPDNWERWCRSRDERDDRAASVRHVSYEMTGYEDLDDYGSWTNVAGYGWGWQPRVAYGWAPYRHGHWRWVGAWGWTWLDDAPWGFAPFHYGRWACLHNNWYWFPGAYVTRPVYAPALVAFFGGANWGVSIGFGVGHVGWFPLAPGEVWIPHYHASHHYLHSVNHMHLNGRHIDYGRYNVAHGTYVNRAIPGAVTAVPNDTFRGARAVARDAVMLDNRAVMRASVVGASAPVAPRVDSVVGRRAGYVARPPSTVLDRAVVARAQPASAPVPFAAQERAIQANGGRPLDETAMARLRSAPGERAVGGPVRMAGARNGAFRGQPSGSDTGRGDGDGAGSMSAAPGTYGAGAAAIAGARRPGGARAGEPTPNAAPAASGANPRPDINNDRPSWARPRAATGDTAPSSPRSGIEDRPGVRSRPDTGNGPAGGAVASPGTAGQAMPRWGGERPNPPSGNAAPSNNERPTFARPGGDQARPRGGERPNPPNGGATPSNNEPLTFGRPGSEQARPRGGETRSGGDTRPNGSGNLRPSGGDNAGPSGTDNTRPSGGDNARPSGGDGPRPGGARQPHGGQPSAPASQPPPAAQPRSGVRGRDSASFESSSRPGYSYGIERPGYGYRADRGTAAARSMPSAPEYRPTPQYRAMPDSLSAPRPGTAVRQYRAIPDVGDTVGYKSAPQFRSLPARPATPEYRATPSPQAPPRGVMRSSGGAGERRDGGGPASAAPAPRSAAPSGGGHAAPRGARNRGGG